jgi:ribosome-binding factor A
VKEIMPKQRTDRLNSLLKEVISEVIRKDVRNPHVNELITVTRVDITKDLHYAKVYISVIGTDDAKQETIQALQSASGFIAVHSSKKVVMRYFPELTFKLDDSLDKQMRIYELLHEISEEKKEREQSDNDAPNS